MSKWKRFKNWLIRKLGGYTEEQTKIVEKILEKPIDEIRFTYYQAEPVCVKSQINLSLQNWRFYLEDTKFNEHINEVIAKKIGEQIANDDLIAYRTIYQPRDNTITVEFETNILLTHHTHNRQHLEESLSMFKR